LCIFAATDTYSNVSFWTKDPQEGGALIYASLHITIAYFPLPLTTTYYLRQNIIAGHRLPHLHSSVIPQILLDCPDEDLQSASCSATLALKQ